MMGFFSVISNCFMGGRVSNDAKASSNVKAEVKGSSSVDQKKPKGKSSRSSNKPPILVSYFPVNSNMNMSRL